MTRQQFARNLELATAAVRQNTERCCWNELPPGNKYLVILNGSYDGHPLAPGEYVFPDHDVPQADVTVPYTGDEVVERLWRNGKMPEWIDLTPYEIIGEVLHIQLLCCGRFTEVDGHLYHQREGYPPFHKFGPILPPEFTDLERDGKFDLRSFRDRKKRTP